MKVFVTGATGFIESHVVQDLIEHGHQVIALARSNNSAEALVKQGVEVIRGELSDLEVLKAGASRADAVAHLGYIHDFTNYGKTSLQIDLAAITAIAEVVKGTGKPFINTTATGVAPLGGGLLTEDPVISESDGHPVFPRIRAEKLLEDLSKQGVHGITMRLPPTVHGDHDHGFIPAIIGFARAQGFSAYVGEGSITWPTVHVKDAASAYRLALEHKAPAGSKLHGVQEEGITFKTIAEIIGQKLGVPTKSIPESQAKEHFQFLAGWVQLNNRASSEKTRELLGWAPKHVGLIEDLETGRYFDEGAGTKFT